MHFGQIVESFMVEGFVPLSSSSPILSLVDIEKKAHYLVIAYYVIHLIHSHFPRQWHKQG